MARAFTTGAGQLCPLMNSSSKACRLGNVRDWPITKLQQEARLTSNQQTTVKVTGSQSQGSVVSLKASSCYICQCFLLVTSLDEANCHVPQNHQEINSSKRKLASVSSPCGLRMRPSSRRHPACSLTEARRWQVYLVSSCYFFFFW